MKVGKPKSKRTPVRLRHKIEKASAAKQKKQKKLAKKNPEWRTRLKKDPGIPNLFPYKDRILAEIEEKKRLKEEDAARRREEAKATKAGKTVADEDAMADDQDEEEDASVMMEDDLDGGEDEGEDGSNPMAALLTSARARAAEFDHGAHGDEDGDEEDSWDGLEDADDEPASFSKRPRPESSRRAFGSSFNELLSSADVLLYVLDARDPLGTRSRAIERQIMAADGGSKRLVLVLNKIDLVPPHALRAWMLHLRRYFPTLPLRASKPAPNAKTWDHRSLTVKGTTETLVKALKSYRANQGAKASISVGVVGYPNVGKSSVINALRARLGERGDACPVGAEAGVTTSLRQVKLDGKIKLIDSPGIVFPSGGDEERPGFLGDGGGGGRKPTRKLAEQARLILLNAVPPKEIDDPVPAVDLLLQRLSALSAAAAPPASASSAPDPYGSMLSFYGIPALLPATAADGGGGGGGGKDSTTDFLVQVARKRGRLGRGGVPNLGAAAFTVINDWRDGRIQGWVEAPRLAARERERGGVGAGDDVEMDLVEGPRAADRAPAPDRKVIVSEWAAEFRIEGLWGDGQGDGVEDAGTAMVVG